MENLKEKTIRGGVARLAAQGANFVLRLGSLMILARLLGPRDFGLVGMVTAFTGILDLFRDFGLSAAAVQRRTVTEEQVSTLFWINILVGVVLGLVAVVMAPAVAHFYHEPRLAAVTTVLGAGFLFNAAGVQHSAMLQRQMRFTALSIIATGSLLAGVSIAIVGAIAGYGYWALVAMTVTTPLFATIGFWIAAAWVPTLPHRQTGIHSMMRFGGAVTLNSLLSYFALNLDKILLGRFWGADALGIYGRAYQLVNVPTGNLNVAAGEVAFSALSRLQDHPSRLRHYFLKGYSLVLAMTIPITTACMIFAHDLTLVLLGPKWRSSADIVRLLAPTILVLAIINPLGWLMTSVGLVGRNLKVSLVFAPLISAGYVLGLPYGPKGVALGFSAAMVLCAVPLAAYCVRGTPVSLRDMIETTRRPLASAIVAGVFGFGVRAACGDFLSPMPRLALEGSVLVVTFAVMLLFVAGQKSFYVDLFCGLIKRSSVQSEGLTTA
ncbi:MAG TPA: lipopolysaccharide biosynthesis protein [Terriglobales bacterium]|nr:lipopolysaccharide biosynthesis protein [Terriglobales bacterium]